MCYELNLTLHKKLEVDKLLIVFGIKSGKRLLPNCLGAFNAAVDLREKIQDHRAVPENDIEGYVAYDNILDENEDEETRFATKRTLAFLKRYNCLNVDATYRLNWHGYPVVVVGCTSKSGKFFCKFHSTNISWRFKNLGRNILFCSFSRHTSKV